MYFQSYMMYDSNEMWDYTQKTIIRLFHSFIYFFRQPLSRVYVNKKMSMSDRREKK